MFNTDRETELSATKIRLAQALAALDCIVSPLTDDVEKLKAMHQWLTALSGLVEDKATAPKERDTARELLARTLHFADAIDMRLEKLADRGGQPRLANGARAALLLLRHQVKQASVAEKRQENPAVN